MPNEGLIRQVLEQMMESQHTPEEACRDHPEILPEVRDRWQRIQALEAQVEALFPTPPKERAGGARRRRSLEALAAAAELPHIAGYQFEGILGSGGMGVVYKARHLKLKRPVAIKMLLAGTYATPEELACLMREAQAVAGLKHASIVQVHDVGDLDGLPYFTMEYVEGGTLAKKLGGVPQPAREAAALVASLARAVHAAHEGGIVHRDLKPANILLATDGTPKIADFSLARNFGDSAVTMTSARVGTPSYMAPEQVHGNVGAFCPSVDIYALGAILYEVLTGRPPFRAETPAETQRQVVEEEPALPSRLNAKVPKDLETICLKCLRKEPDRRYPSAAALADDLQRFLQGEPITARPTAKVERAFKWFRRNPAKATAFAAVALIATSLMFGATWMSVHRKELADAVTEDLREVARREQASQWLEARTALERAKARGAVATALQQQLAQAERDLELVVRLDQIRVKRAVLVQGDFSLEVNKGLASAQYEDIFREVGLTNMQDEAPAAVAARIRTSGIRTALVAAIDDWAACNTRTKDRSRLAWLLEVGRLADPDPTGWRDKVRNVEAWEHRNSLATLTDQMPPTEHSLALLLAIGERLREDEEGTEAFLRRVQHNHPADFWANFTLGLAIGERDPDETVRFLQAALALRPDVAVAHANLGVALAQANRLDEGLAELKEAIRMAPGVSAFHNNLGNCYLAMKRHAEAIESFRRSIELEPNYTYPHNNLGKALIETRRLDEAITEYRKAVELDPEYVTGLIGLALALHMKGQDLEAIEQCQKALTVDPQCPEALVNLALAQRTLGRLNEALQNLEKAIKLEANPSIAHYNLGLVLVDLGRLTEAAGHYREALRLNPKYANAHHGLGVIAGDSGDLDRAITHFKQALESDPTFLLSSGALGRALMAQGKFSEAQAPMRRYLETLTEGSPGYEAIAGYIHQCQVLDALDARLPAVLKGDDEPATGGEYLLLAEICRIRKQPVDAATLFQHAFDHDPALADDPRASHRYNAACMAALTGAVTPGSQSDDGELQRHAKWRGQARSWLRADLAVFETRLTSTEPQLPQALKAKLTRWQSDPDLRSIRDEVAIEALDVQEQQECRKLWNEVAALLSRL